MADLSAYNLTGTNNPAYAISVTKWNQLLAAIAAGDLTEEQVRDIVGTLLVAGSGVSITPNDDNNTITISATGGTGGTSYTDEQVRDVVAAMLVSGTGISIFNNDAGDQLSITATGGGGGVTDPEVVRDTIAAALVAGTGVTITPNDGSDTITISATGGGGTTDPEVVRDTIASALVAGTNVTIIPDDTANTITIHASGGAGGAAGPMETGLLFTGFGSATLGATVTRVRTSGYSIPGIGGADYIYDASITAAIAADNPRTHVMNGTRGFRLDPNQFLTLQMVGGIADCTAVGSGTDNAPAYNAFKKFANRHAGVTLNIPAGHYRFSSRLTHTESFSVRGAGWSSNPGIVSGTTYSGIFLYEGTVLVFDVNTPGMIFYSQTDSNDAIAVHAANQSQGTASPEYKFKGSRQAVVEHFMLYGGGGTNVDAHGIELRSVVKFTGVRAEFFAGTGFRTDASGHQFATPYGIADQAGFRDCTARTNKCHGFYTSGNDANVILFDNCDSAVNGGMGFLDKGQLGSTYMSCHAATNNQTFAGGADPGAMAGETAARARVQADWPRAATYQYESNFITSSEVAAHMFIGCYMEGGTNHIRRPSIVIGGNIASASAIPADLVDPGVVYGFNEMLNMDKIKATRSGILTLDDTDLIVSRPGGSSGQVRISVRPGISSYSHLEMRGGNDVIADGLLISAGFGTAYHSVNSTVFRDAAQAVTFATVDTNGIDLKAGARLAIGGTKVVGTRQAAIANHASDATVNAILTAMRAHGLIAP